MLADHFTNPPAEGKLNGNNSVEAGISEMLQRFETGRLQIFKSCQETLEELRLYHRKNGKVVAIKDDLISAMKYSYDAKGLALYRKEKKKKKTKKKKA